MNQFGSLDFNCSSASTGLKHTNPTAVTAIAFAICLCAMDRNRNNNCYDTTKYLLIIWVGVGGYRYEGGPFCHDTGVIDIYVSLVMCFWKQFPLGICSQNTYP